MAGVNATSGGGSNSAPVKTGPPNAEVSTEEKGLSLRDALEVGIAASKSPEDLSKDSGTVPDGLKDSRRTSAPAATTDSEREETPEEKASSSPDVPPLQAPAEFTGEEKSDFVALPRKQQEAVLRIHRGRTQLLEQIKSETRNKNEASKKFSDIEALATAITPYLRARGVKDPSEVAIKRAVDMWAEFENAKDPYAAAAAYLKAKNLKVPKELETHSTAAFDDSALKEKITPLQERIDRLESERAQERVAVERQQLSAEWQVFEAAKNAAGQPKYADVVGDGDAALRLTRNIGSLVGGKSELSKQFIAQVTARIPNCTYQQLLDEAYRWHGGKVTDAQTPRTQESQASQIKRSKRAAAVQPGNGERPAQTGERKKYKNTRDALAAAVREVQEAERGY